MYEVLRAELASIGDAALSIIFEDMEAHGFRFQTDSYYSITEIHAFLGTVLGEDTANLVAERILRSMGTT